MQSETPFNIQFQGNSFVDSRPRATMLSGAATCFISREVASAVPPLDLVPADYTLVYDAEEARCRDLWFEGPRGGLLLEVSVYGVRIAVTGLDRGTLDEVMAEVDQRAGKRLERGRRVQLWWKDDHGPAHNAKRLETEPWEKVRRNYPAATARRLDEVMQLREPTQSGRLLLWHGEPGTGKTSAALALVDAWHAWCEPHIITDPERMFGDSQYLMQVLTSPVMGPSGGVDVSVPTAMRWRLILCEDADEYLRADARARSGPALGRLLNATDGLLGRGTKTLILLTTNDELGRLHPAVTRPGRCLDLTEFPRFSADEASVWLGWPAPAAGATLAELYHLEQGQSVREPDRIGAYL